MLFIRGLYLCGTFDIRDKLLPKDRPGAFR